MGLSISTPSSEKYRTLSCCARGTSINTINDPGLFDTATIQRSERHVHHQHRYRMNRRRTDNDSSPSDAVTSSRRCNLVEAGCSRRWVSLKTASAGLWLLRRITAAQDSCDQLRVYFTVALFGVDDGRASLLSHRSSWFRLPGILGS